MAVLTGNLVKTIAIWAVALSLVACNSTEATLDVSGENVTEGVAVQTTAPPPATVVANGQATTTSTLGDSAAVASSTTPNPTSTPAPAPAATPSASNIAAVSQSQVYFAPIVGAPVDKVTALSRRLSAASPTRGVRLSPSKASGINHEIRGYFSALSENGQTTVIHVWDVFTPNGQRVHRIQAQERVSGVSADPWRIVPAATMEAIAEKVLAEYSSWRGGRA
ncbi:MAG: hypothetical protein AAFP99_02720 [Pseudomonadota bacterium]